MAEFGYDLLKNYYLCGSSSSANRFVVVRSCVVICLKFTTFVVVATVPLDVKDTSFGCDLLKIYYLCGSSNSSGKWN